jgi:hypothetical protein
MKSSERNKEHTPSSPKISKGPSKKETNALTIHTKVAGKINETTILSSKAPFPDFHKDVECPFIVCPTFSHSLTPSLRVAQSNCKVPYTLNPTVDATFPGIPMGRC